MNSPLEKYRTLSSQNRHQEIIIDFLGKINQGSITQEQLLEDLRQDLDMQATIVFIYQALLELQCYREIIMLLTFVKAEDNFEQRLAEYSTSCLIIARQGKDDCLKQALQNLGPRHHALQLIHLYWLGCSLHVQKKFGQALAVFTKFKQAITPDSFRILPFLENSTFNLMFRQGTLVTDADEAKYRLQEYADSRAIGNLQFVVRNIACDKNPDTPVIMISADGFYFQEFIPSLVESIARNYASADVHLNIINARAHDIASGQQLCAVFAHLSFDISTIDAKYDNQVNYSVARFYALEVLLPLYRRKILCLDADLSMTDKGKSVIDNLPDCDFACMNSGRNEPASFYAAGVMLFGFGKNTMDFLKAVVCFCESKIDLPPHFAWMLDQAAIYSVRHYFDHNKLPLNFFEIANMYQNLKDYFPFPFAANKTQEIKNKNKKIQQLSIEAMYPFVDAQCWRDCQPL